MDKSTTRNEQKVKNNSRYQRDIERSFAVIYHNLKRIQDDKQQQRQERLTRRRSHSEPEIPTPNRALLENYEQKTVSRESSQNHDARNNKRRVSFAGIVNHASIPENNGTRVVDPVCSLPEREKNREMSQDCLTRRRHSEPQIRAPIPELLRKYEETSGRERSNSLTCKESPDLRNCTRRVSFCDSVNSTLKPERHGSKAT